MAKGQNLFRYFKTSPEICPRLACRCTSDFRWNFEMSKTFFNVPANVNLWRAPVIRSSRAVVLPPVATGLSDSSQAEPVAIIAVKINPSDTSVSGCMLAGNVTPASASRLSAPPRCDLAPDLGSGACGACGRQSRLWQRHAVSLERYAMWPGVHYVD